jgi:hypothetical protein
MKHEIHPHLNPLPSRERISLIPPLVGGIKGRRYFRNNPVKALHNAFPKKASGKLPPKTTEQEIS